MRKRAGAQHDDSRDSPEPTPTDDSSASPMGIQKRAVGCPALSKLVRLGSRRQRPLGCRSAIWMRERVCRKPGLWAALAGARRMPVVEEQAGCRNALLRVAECTSKLAAMSLVAAPWPLGAEQRPRPQTLRPPHENVICVRVMICRAASSQVFTPARVARIPCGVDDAVA
jgi:hypothetical protein